MSRFFACACALVVTALLAAAPATARERITGIVLMTPANGTAIVRHEAFAGMPAMAMPFALPAGTVVHPGERLSADVDRSSEPWKLSAIRVLSAAPVAQLAPPAFVQAGDRMPNVPFVDARGRATTLAALHGHPYALTFIYTRCRDQKMCPLVSAKLEAVQARTRGTSIALVEVSLDPAYDRPAVLTRYGAMYGADPARWHLLTGDPRTVLDFAARFRILERAAGPETILHTERLAIVDAGGTIVRLFDDATWRAGDVADVLRGL